MDFKIKDKLLSNISKTELKEVKGIIIHSSPNLYDNKAQYGGFTEINKLNKDKVDFGFHYGIDQYDVVRYIDSKHKAKSLLADKPTYISTALYKQKPEDHCISIGLFIHKEHDYEYTEKYFVRFLVKLLREYKLESKDIWRGFDLSKEDKGPFHILDTKVFKKYLTEIDKYLDITDEKLTEAEQDKLDDAIKFVSPYKYSVEDDMTINEYVNNIFKDNKDKAVDYVKKFNPWNKDIKEIIDAGNDATVGDLQMKEYPTGNKFQYKISQSAPIGSCDCTKASDKLEGSNTTKETMVEPIYPDLITPPGGEIHVANGTSETVSQGTSNTPLTVEEFEKRQKTFSIDNFKDVKKQTIGRPINCEDPFPVDLQIKKLEEHFPKVKIDNIQLAYEDDNHLGSEIGAAISKNYNMCYDMVSEISKRTEQRLVKLENNLATTMRNLFRMSSRVNINCVYYGGQSVYGKYNCIRCLQDDRINDGAIVSLDQCLSCTRYEPIEGQVYAILDEAGSNVVQVIDDMQMAYMGLEQYKDFNTVKEMHLDMPFANLKNDASETPKEFSKSKWEDSKEEVKIKTKNKEKDKDYVNGFRMDWNPTLLETQAPAINKYEMELKVIDKKDPVDLNQGIDRELFIDSRENAIEYEKLEFDIANYVLEGFGSKGGSGSSGDGIFGLGATDVRNKIVKYAMDAVELSKQGKALYSQTQRYNHGDKAVNGIHYWDCSSLVQRAYEAAGITGIGTTTHNQYPPCLTSAGGTLFPLSSIDDALPGDLVWFKEPPVPTDVAGFQTVPYTDGMIVHHVAIYIGNKQYAHAAYEGANPDIKVSTLGFYNHEMCFGRCKKLIDLDKQSSSGIAGEGYWNRQLHAIPDKLWNLAGSAEGNAGKAIENMAKYNYKDVLIQAAKAKKYDPYLVLAIAATESSGNPTIGGYGGQDGLMQTDGGSPASSVEGIKAQIELALNNLDKKKIMLKQYGWTEDNLAVLMHAYNCGEGSTTTASGHFQQSSFPMPKVNLSTCKIPEIGEALGSYAEKYGNISMPDARRAYPTKVLRAYNYLFAKKALG